MDYKLIHAAYAANVGGSSIKSVLVCICCHAKERETGIYEAWPSLSQLSSKTELNRKTIIDCVKKLELMPFFSSELKNGKGKLYRITIEHLTSTNFGTGTKINTGTNFTSTSTKNGTGTSTKIGTTPVPILEHKECNKSLNKNINKNSKDGTVFGTGVKNNSEFEFDGVIPADYPNNSQNFKNRMNGEKNATHSKTYKSAHAQRIDDYAQACIDRAEAAAARLANPGELE